ncbi:MAG TPA: hypothetical protein VMM76_07600 [Pirellulaceae bacterium]|nr:hypothetical protein [Pirellulaceae bacterium]
MGRKNLLKAKRRTGTVYVTVVVIAIVVTLLTASAMRLARFQLRNVRNEHDRHAARLLAASAIDHALALFNNDASWESTYSLNVEYPATPVVGSGGSFTWRLFDQGSGRKRLDGIGRVEDAACVLSVDLGVATPALLSYPVNVGGDLRIGNTAGSSNVLRVIGGPAVSNGDLRNENILNGSVEAQSESVSGTVTGTKTIPGTYRPLPRSARVMRYYLTNGTVIANASLPSTGLLEKLLLSPATNPFGATDPNGIYIIDSPGKDLTIRDCRVVGTLVIRNSGYKVTLSKAVNWEPARTNWPALIVEGDLVFAGDDSNVDLQETTTNFNPSGTPWKGDTDSDTSDEYPNALMGIFYATGEIRFDGNDLKMTTEIEGVVIAEGRLRLTKDATPKITYDGTAAADPPPGFGPGDPASLVPGTWRQTASP